jgi:Mrp family chromosome partitioning ATPase
MRSVGARVRSSKVGSGVRRVELVDLSREGVRWIDPDASAVQAGERVELVLPARRLFGRTLKLEGVVIRREAAQSFLAARFLPGGDPGGDQDRLERYIRRAQARFGAGAERAAAAAAPVASAFRLIGVSLDGGGAARPAIVMISSPRAGEGKSFVAAGVASALAAMGRTVLLLDADVQNPVQHLTFQVNPRPGLVQLLGEPSTLPPEAAVQIGANGVAVLPAGSAGAIRDLLSPDLTRQVSNMLRALPYSTIVVDAPPVLEAPDALLLARIAGETLLTVRSGLTRSRDVKQALGMLKRQGTPAAGVILNDHLDALGSPRTDQDGARRLAAAPGARRAPRASDRPVAAEPRTVDSEGMLV